LINRRKLDQDLKKALLTIELKAYLKVCTGKSTKALKTIKKQENIMKDNITILKKSLESRIFMFQFL